MREERLRNNDVGQQERERSCAVLSRQQYKEKQGSLQKDHNFCLQHIQHCLTEASKMMTLGDEDPHRGSVPVAQREARLVERPDASAYTTSIQHCLTDLTERY